MSFSLILNQHCLLYSSVFAIQMDFCILATRACCLTIMQCTGSDGVSTVFVFWGVDLTWLLETRKPTCVVSSQKYVHDLFVFRFYMFRLVLCKTLIHPPHCKCVFYFSVFVMVCILTLNIFKIFRLFIVMCNLLLKSIRWFALFYPFLLDPTKMFMLLLQQQ